MAYDGAMSFQFPFLLLSPSPTLAPKPSGLRSISKPEAVQFHRSATWSRQKDTWMAGLALGVWQSTHRKLELTRDESSVHGPVNTLSCFPRGVFFPTSFSRVAFCVWVSRAFLAALV